MTEHLESDTYTASIIYHYLIRDNNGVSMSRVSSICGSLFVEELVGIVPLEIFLDFTQCNVFGRKNGWISVSMIHAVRHY